MFKIFGKYNALFVRPKIRGAIRAYQVKKKEIGILCCEILKNNVKCTKQTKQNKENKQQLQKLIHTHT